MSSSISETFNVWSHFISAIIFALSGARFAGTLIKRPGMDELMILLYIAAAVLFFSFSAIYHASASASHNEAGLLQRLDHLGVVVIIWATSVSFTHFAFIDGYWIRKTYGTLISMSAIFSMSYLWQSPLDQLGLRAAVYSALGGLATLPAAHLSYWTCRQSLTEVESHLLRSFWCLLAFNSTGGLIYVFDLLQFVGTEASHNAMHVTVMIGTWVYLQGLITIKNQDRRAYLGMKTKMDASQP